MTDVCPCGSGRTLAACCGRHHAGEPAPDPESLMRSRFSAFALDRMDYLRATWHPDTCPDDLSPDAATQWRHLEILQSDVQGDEGRVLFLATWQAGADWGRLREHSRFLRQGGQWYYHSGEAVTERLRPSRNAPCPCGSGRKLKRCCGDPRNVKI